MTNPFMNNTFGGTALGMLKMQQDQTLQLLRLNWMFEKKKRLKDIILHFESTEDIAVRIWDACSLLYFSPQEN